MKLTGTALSLLKSWTHKLTRWNYKQVLKQMPNHLVAEQLLEKLEAADIPFEHWPSSDELLRLYVDAVVVIEQGADFAIEKTDRRKMVPDQTQSTNDCWACAHHDCGCGSPWYTLVISEREEWCGYDYHILPLANRASLTNPSVAL